MRLESMKRKGELTFHFQIIKVMLMYKTGSFRTQRGLNKVQSPIFFFLLIVESGVHTCLK